MLPYSLYWVLGDGSKQLVKTYATLAAAQADMTDGTKIYSIEYFQDPIITVLL